MPRVPSACRVCAIDILSPRCIPFIVKTAVGYGFGELLTSHALSLCYGTLGQVQHTKATTIPTILVSLHHLACPTQVDFACVPLTTACARHPCDLVALWDITADVT